MPDPARIPGIERGAPYTFEFDGRAVEAHEGESLAAALLAAGLRATRSSAMRGEPRGYFCGMGVCWECVVEVEGMGLVRACRFPAAADLRVFSAVR
jgi:hypothetical protein